jgi:predicted SprT family Zn-dependent metalloprotease
MTFFIQGIEFNDKRIAKLTLECLDELKAIDIYPCKLKSVKIRKQNTKFGVCHTKYIKATDEIIRNDIVINRAFVEQNADDKAIKNVIMHELGHALKDCLHCGHKGEWAEYAEIINDCYDMDITQEGSYEKYGLEKVDNKKTYRCKCSNCGKIIVAKQYRAPKWYRNPQGFVHTCADGTKHHIISEYYNEF